MRYYLPLIIFLTSFSMEAFGQFTYRLDQSTIVESNGTALQMPWAGGLNSAQINKMDLNGDGKEDLVVFERMANVVRTYLNEGGAWHYEPIYQSLFPAEVDQWLLLRDFNCDGRKDIFTHDNLGIAVYVNITPPGGALKWRRFNPGNTTPAFPLFTIGLSGITNLQTNATDIAAIEDIDGDGDLDILDAHFDGVGSLEWHKNMSIENTGKCDSMQLVLVTQKWGHFEECNCGEYLFGTNSCAIYGGRTSHAAGKSILGLDFDGDGDKDLLFSEETCTDIYFLENFGTKDSANFTGYTTFPQTHPIVNFQIFPATYYEDVDFDGVPDLVMTSNIYTRTVPQIDFMNSLWYYKNTGTAALPNFTFVKSNFLQDQMIDVGDNSSPAFIDEDGDGDLDMFISSYTNLQNISYLFFYENIGTSTQPHFKYVTNDYAHISQFNFSNMKIQFVDMNGDGKKDFAFTASAALTGITALYFLKNVTSNLDISDAVPENTGFTVDVGENILVVDVNQDGLNDLLVGKSTGALQYWVSTGSSSTFNYLLQNPAFLGLATSTSRQSPVAATGDLDQDGKNDLILSDQSGTLTIYSNLKSQQNNGVNNILYDSLLQVYDSKNLGGRLWPVSANIFNSSFPSIITGNLLGGIQILKNDNPDKLPEKPVISTFPNPASADKYFYIRTDRDLTAQLYTIFGQKILDPLTLTGNEDYKFPTNGLASGTYIMRFFYNSKYISQRVVIP